MITYTRPPEPEGFLSDDLREEEARIERAAKAGLPIDVDSKWWKDHKPVFSAAQFGKCGFCERDSRGEHGSVEHYAPKGEVADLERKGTEGGLFDPLIDRPKQLKNRRTPGYYWRALCWDNWLYCCTICNSTWKSILFPVEQDPRPEPHPSIPFTPLLLHPYEVDVDPLQHLSFDTAGQVRGIGARGVATIDTVGLDRASLVDARVKTAGDIDRWCDRFLSAASEQGRREAVEDLWSACQPSRPYAGTARSRVMQRLEMDWLDLRFLLSSSPPTVSDGVLERTSL
jgi:hypothetical protein